jgi:hypothetical protein
MARRDGHLDFSYSFGVCPDNYMDTKGGAERLIDQKLGPRRRTFRRLHDSDCLHIRSFSLSLTLAPYRRLFNDFSAYVQLCSMRNVPPKAISEDRCRDSNAVCLCAVPLVPRTFPLG